MRILVVANYNADRYLVLKGKIRRRYLGIHSLQGFDQAVSDIYFPR